LKQQWRTDKPLTRSPRIDLTAPDFLNQQAAGINATQFLGYTQPSTAQVTTLIANSKPVESAEAGTEVQVMLDQTPFYAESGQIGDRGYCRAIPS